ncbi:GNAT family N-acetyltransferase [Hymenobacter sp. BRD67]|uniref:GNAT family N-acetyltransferase n=1 Tax=Hymenobacter sp. BRD67 TaxID=2675877 RepID=UPI001564DE18|nr:GNAT family N-acetyltransferase [Hymenobacter sp. BRD67]QKG52026.1 GNAT family N-acetyltransferase [Hymenobacter sp. BRD67]
MTTQSKHLEASSYSIISLEPTQTYALRQAVLWPDKPLTYVQLPDDAAGQHFGALVGGELRAVISLFVAGAEARFRKFATDPAWQGRGLGTALLRHITAVARAQGARTLGCDARMSTLPFYRRFGLAPAGDVFYKGDLAYVKLSCLL